MGQEVNDPEGKHAFHLAIQQQCQPEGQEHSHRDRGKGVIEGVADGFPEKVILGHLDEVLNSHELGETGQIPFRESQIQRGGNGEETEDQNPYQIRDQKGIAGDQVASLSTVMPLDLGREGRGRAEAVLVSPLQAGS